MDKLFTKLSVIGLDDPGAAVRSIGVTRTSVYHGHFTTPAHPGVPETDAEHLYGDLFRANDTNCGERYMGARCEQGGYIPSTLRQFRALVTTW